MPGIPSRLPQRLRSHPHAWPPRGLSYICLTKSTLTVRISEEEKSALALRAQAEDITTGALVRRIIREKTFVTSEDLLAEMQASMGDKRLAIKKRA